MNQQRKLASDITIRLRAVVETMEALGKEMPATETYAKFLREALEWSKELEKQLQDPTPPEAA